MEMLEKFFRIGAAIYVFYILFMLSLVGGSIYVIHHFISKYW